MSESPPSLVVDVFADIACPWCYIGERRLHRAIDALRTETPGLEAEVRWRPFQLQPDLPADGLPWRPFAEHKFGGWDAAQDSFRYVERAARTDDIEFRFEDIARAANTTDAHRLLLFAETRGRTASIAEALFRAYFTEGRDIGDLDTLVEIGAAEGLDEGDVRAFLESDLGRAEVQAAQEAAERMGISGVPFYIIDRRYALSGAQPEQAFREVLKQALAETEQDAG